MADTQDDPLGYLPLSPAVFHVLVALGDGDRHGYGIIKDVAEHSGGAQRLGAGTLYAILKRLLDDALVEEVKPVATAGTEDQRRRYYRLTPFGRRVARAEVERLERASALARSTRLFGRTRQA